ncbi:MAG: extracellular solute-binding protein [Erysipelotrichaceae bacterium]|jgi:arabinogalactan oligomer/maltooligosaccharide transport system substrate-binding protein|nr:extracellular solute-binding protein [Erysipelotrichaceae bacterium]
MKRISLILVVFSILLTLPSCSSPREICVGPNCTESASFAIEEEASLQIVVKNDQMGQDIVALWNAAHPEHAGIVSYVVDPRPSTELYQTGLYDLMYVETSQVPLLMDRALVLPQRFDQYLSLTEMAYLTTVVNREQLYFVPVDTRGNIFAYNVTLLESLGIDLSTTGSHGLPAAISSWEQIFELSKTLKEQESLPFSLLYPVDFEDRWYLYPLLSSGGWEIFANEDVYYSGFGSEAFTSGLEFIKALSANQIDRRQDISADWSYDQVLSEQSALFLTVNDWLYLKDFQASGDYVLGYGPYPTWKEITPTPLKEVFGYLIYKNTSFPNAASELLRLICSKEMIQANIDNPDLYPLVPKDQQELFVFSDPQKLQMIDAYRYSILVPLYALKENPAIRGWQLYMEIDFIPSIEALYHNEITIEEAQSSFENLGSLWYKEHRVAP